MKFELTRPCTQCPFRSDRPGFLRPARVHEIFRKITESQQSFTCHKTLSLSLREHQHCAGALILLEALEQPNQAMRIAERLGLYDRQRLDMDSPVFTDVDEMAEHHWRRS